MVGKFVLGGRSGFLIAIFWTTWFPVLELPKYSELFVVCSRKEKQMLYELLRMLASLSLCSRRNMWGFLNLKEIFLREDGGGFAIIADYSYPIIDCWQLWNTIPRFQTARMPYLKNQRRGQQDQQTGDWSFNGFWREGGPKVWNIIHNIFGHANYKLLYWMLAYFIAQEFII